MRVNARPTLPPGPPGSLAEARAAVPDPRRPDGGRPDYPPIPLGALVQVPVAAMLGGSVGQTAIAQGVRARMADDRDLVTALGRPAGRVPCVATFHRVCKARAGAAFEPALGRWREQTGIAPGAARAVDGKAAPAVRGVARDGVPGVSLVSGYAHAAETVIAPPRTAGKGHARHRACIDRGARCSGRCRSPGRS